jgi:KDO2-lipid IV(A) lauroyltransferase
MALYLSYLTGFFLCSVLPRRACYAMARRVADVWLCRAPPDEEAVRGNLEAILGRRASAEEVRQVFRNFSMYLVDFFRFGRLTPDRVRRLIRFDGVERMEEALRQGRGAIGITAHLGNYELAGAVLSLLGMPLHGVVLSHRNPWVDDFFTRQRAKARVSSIPVQRMTKREFLQRALSVLNRNEVLGLVADRDYFDHGIVLPLFGKSIRLPTGPAGFSLRTAAPIVPCFLIREENGGYRLILERPLRAPRGAGREAAIRHLTEQWRDVLARVLRRYPTQWYMFQSYWRPGPVLIR